MPQQSGLKSRDRAAVTALSVCWGGGAGSTSNTFVAWAEAYGYLRTKWYTDASISFGHNRHGQKSGGCCAPPVWEEGEAGSLSNTMSMAWARPTSVSSGRPSQ